MHNNEYLIMGFQLTSHSPMMLMFLLLTKDSQGNIILSIEYETCLMKEEN